MEDLENGKTRVQCLFCKHFCILSKVKNLIEDEGILDEVLRKKLLEIFKNARAKPSKTKDVV